VGFAAAYLAAAVLRAAMPSVGEVVQFAVAYAVWVVVGLAVTMSFLRWFSRRAAGHPQGAPDDGASERQPSPPVAPEPPVDDTGTDRKEEA
jgi:hypothetical protein